LVQRNELTPGTNRLRLRVRTNLIRAFEGQRFDTETHAYRDL
jgi:hypothetical protein